MQLPTGTVIHYSVVQTLFQIGAVLVVAVAALSGRTIAPSPEYATLPLALSVIGTLAGLYPSALFMNRAGRKAGFAIGTVLGIAGVALILGGLYLRQFGLFTAGFLLYGVHQSSLQYLRFAAMEAAGADHRPQALSWILIAGIPAAFLGPLFGNAGSELVASVPYWGSFGLLGVCLILQLVVISLLKRQASSEGTEVVAIPRPFGQILRQPNLWVAVAASTFGYGLMVMLMAAVPMAMNEHGHHGGDSALVLQWHVLGMYVPSFFSGWLIKRLGKKGLILAGILVMSLEAGIAMLGYSFPHFAVALVLLGIGWNFMYVGGTNLLTDQYAPAEKSRVQAFNDIIVFGFGSIFAYGAGFLHEKLGWFTMNLFVLPVLAGALVVVLLSRIKTRQSVTS